jgi:hypothetical protein
MFPQKIDGAIERKTVQINHFIGVTHSFVINLADQSLQDTHNLTSFGQLR